MESQVIFIARQFYYSQLRSRTAQVLGDRATVQQERERQRELAQQLDALLSAAQETVS